MTHSGVSFWARIALRFLVRSGRATTALSIMVVTAVSALIFLSALAVGVNDAMLENSVGLFSGHISASGLPASLGPEDLSMAGVLGVLRRVYVRGVLSNGRLDEPLTLCGVNPDRETAFTALEKKTVSGRYLENGEGEIFISRALANDFGVLPGKKLRFAFSSGSGPLTLTVCGIYETGIESLDRGIAFCPLTAMSEAGKPWSAAVFLEPGVDAKRILDIYRQKWPSRGIRFESWETLMPDLRQLIDLQYFSMGIVIFLVFGVVSVGIACIFVIFIIRNLREYGIMKAMGVTARETWLLTILKISIMNAAACAAGVLIGVLAVWAVAGSGGIDLSAFTSHNRYFAVSGVISPRLTMFSLLASPVTAFVFGLVAAVWPATLVARKKAADIIRMI